MPEADHAGRACRPMRMIVVIASLGRPDVLARTVRHLDGQTRLPDRLVLSVTKAEDAAGAIPSRFPIEVLIGPKGLCRQRNTALEAIKDEGDGVVLFLDDDFVPADDYLEQLERLFASDPTILGATGRIIADGINGDGYSYEAAAALVARDVPPADPGIKTMEALYGCNMAVRLSVGRRLRFDEVLPLYGWLEDIDFTFRVGQSGRLVEAEALAGVHMGTRGGRTSGVKLGYSQIANPVYLLRKRSVPRPLAFRLMRNNLLSNTVRSLKPEPHVDRLGRLRGNMLALGDLMRGRLDPRRILDLG